MQTKVQYFRILYVYFMLVIYSFLFILLFCLFAYVCFSAVGTNISDPSREVFFKDGR